MTLQGREALNAIDEAERAVTRLIQALEAGDTAAAGRAVLSFQAWLTGLRKMIEILARA